MKMAQTRHTFTSDAASSAWIDAYSWADECERREAERAKPQPVITPCLLMVLALAVLVIGGTVLGWEAM